jgi:hypothetical protein
MKKLLLLIIITGTIIQNVRTQELKKITVKEYIETYKDIAIFNMNNYKIPASITLAQGILESANGNSELAKNANNHFGIKCHKGWEGKTYFKDDDTKNECFRVYENPAESFKDHSQFLRSRPRYSSLFLLEITDYKGWAQGLKDAGYATNPNYPQLLIKIIEENKLFLFDIGNANIANVENIPEVNFRQINDEEDDFEAVSIEGNNRRVYLNNNIKFIFAKPDDNFKKIADDFEMKPNEIIRYNDFSENYKLKSGEKVYIQPKRRRGFAEFHIVREGETMFSISQYYGIKLRILYKKNRMETGTQPAIGQKLWLKKRKPAN